MNEYHYEVEVSITSSEAGEKLRLQLSINATDGEQMIQFVL